MAKRKEKKLPVILSDDEVSRFLDTFKKHTKTGFRDYVLFYTLFKTGMRISEALNCRYEDIKTYNDAESGEFYIYRLNSKKSKNRVAADIPIPKDVKSLFLQLSKMYGHRQQGYVFTKVSFDVKNREPMKDAHYRRLSKQKGVEAGLSVPMHPHLTRHYYATTVYQATKDLLLTQKACRHASINSTQVYTHVNPKDVLEAADYIKI